MSYTFPALRFFQVRSLSVDYLRLSWEFNLDTEEVFDLEMQIFRSESPEGPWSEVSKTFRDRYSFVDTTIPVGHRWRQLYYQLRVKHVPTGDTTVYGPASQEAPPDLIALELQRHFMMLYKEFTGRPCWLFPVRTFGPKCPSCYDKRTGARKRSRCTTCFDTSFMHGYLSPILVHVDIDPSANGHQVSTLGKQQQQNTTANMGWYPRVKPDDILVEPENLRWRVVSQAQTEQNRAPVSQQLQLHAIERGDIEMDLPLNEEALELDRWLSPRRNYTNPHNLDHNDMHLLAVMGKPLRGKTI